MSIYSSCCQHPELLVSLHQAHAYKTYDELLDLNTISKPAVWEKASQCLYRIHLDEDDCRLPECKRQIREIKEAIKAQLIEEFGPYTWKARMPVDFPLKDETM